MAAEKRLQNKVLSDLRSFGKDLISFKIMRCNEDGIPDCFFATIATGAVFVELKAPGEAPNPKQQAIIDKMNRCGVKAFACDSIERWIEIKRIVGLVHPAK